MTELASTQPQTSLHSAWQCWFGIQGLAWIGFFVFVVFGIGLGFGDGRGGLRS